MKQIQKIIMATAIWCTVLLMSGCASMPKKQALPEKLTTRNVCVYWQEGQEHLLLPSHTQFDSMKEKSNIKDLTLDLDVNAFIVHPYVISDINSYSNNKDMFEITETENVIEILNIVDNVKVMNKWILLPIQHFPEEDNDAKATFMKYLMDHHFEGNLSGFVAYVDTCGTSEKLLALVPHVSTNIKPDPIPLFTSSGINEYSGVGFLRKTSGNSYSLLKIGIVGTTEKYVIINSSEYISDEINETNYRSLYADYSAHYNTQNFIFAVLRGVLQDFTPEKWKTITGQSSQ